MLSVLMLTPDHGHLDRRIAQEAGTLASRGFTVDIYPVFDTLAASAGGLPTGVRMLTRPEVQTGKRVGAYLQGRKIKRGLERVSPTVHRWVHIVESVLLDTGALSTTEDEALLRAGPRYDLLFAHDIPVLPLATRLAGHWGAAVICDLHEIYPEQHEFRAEWWTYRALRRVQRNYLPLVDGVMAVNPAVLEYVEGEVSLNAPFGVVHNSVPFVRPVVGGTRIHDLFGIPRTCRVLAFAGSLRPDANLEVVIRGFDRAGVDGWALALLGSGPDEDKLRRTVNELGARDRVFLGQRVPQHDLVPVLASAHAGVLPYLGVDLNHMSATPNKLFEYIQARLPIASARLPEVSRILDQTGVGTYLDFSDVDALADDLGSFLDIQVSEVSAEALERTALNVCWERDETVLMEIVDAALAARNHPASAKAQSSGIAGSS